MYFSIINGLKKLTQIAETTEFSGIFGAAVNSKWFMLIMQKAGTYLFTAALVLYVLKLGFAIEAYIRAKNKNLKENASLAWTIFQTGLIATAIIGTLVAAATFLLLTPVLFAAAMGLDTLRNGVLLGWNVFQLAKLYFTQKDQLADNPWKKLKYKHFKNIYLENIKEHAIGMGIGAALTTAVSLIMIFPHIGFGSITLAGITIAGAKLTMMAVCGATASLALAAPLAIPLIKKGLHKLDAACEFVFNKTCDFVVSLFSAKPAQPPKGKEPVKEKAPLNAGIKPKLLIRTNDDLVKASEPLEFDAHSYNNGFRKVIMENIDEENPELAFEAIRNMVTQKIAVLDKQAADNLSWSGWWQQNKRQQKLNALQDILSHLASIEKVNTDSRFAKVVVEKTDDFITRIEKKYPEIDQSFFLQESDTRNILNALKAYGERFRLPSKEEPKQTVSDHIFAGY